MGTFDAYRPLWEEIKSTFGDLPKKNYKCGSSKILKICEKYGDRAYIAYMAATLADINFPRLTLGDQQKFQSVKLEISHLWNDDRFEELFILIFLLFVSCAEAPISEHILSALASSVGLTASQRVAFYLIFLSSSDKAYHITDSICLNDYLSRNFTSQIYDTTFDLPVTYLSKIYCALEISCEKLGISRDHFVSIKSLCLSDKRISQRHLASPFFLTEDCVSFREKFNLYLSRNVEKTNLCDADFYITDYREMNNYIQITPEMRAELLLLFLNSVGKHSVDNSILSKNLKIIDNLTESLGSNTPMNLFTRFLDSPNLEIHSRNSFKILIHCLSRISSPNYVEFLRFLYGIWKNPCSQFCFLKNLIFYREDFDLIQLEHRTVDLRAFQIPPHAQHVASFWNNLDLLETMLRLVENDQFQSVHNILEPVYREIPNIMLHLFMNLAIYNNEILTYFVSQHIRMILHSNNTEHCKILTPYWNNEDERQRSFFISCFLYEVNCMHVEENLESLNYLVQIAKEFGALEFFTKLNNFPIAFDFTIAAAHKDYVKADIVFQEMAARFEDFGERAVARICSRTVEPQFYAKLLPSILRIMRISAGDQFAYNSLVERLPGQMNNMSDSQFRTCNETHSFEYSSSMPLDEQRSSSMVYTHEVARPPNTQEIPGIPSCPQHVQYYVQLLSPQHIINLKSVVREACFHKGKIAEVVATIKEMKNVNHDGLMGAVIFVLYDLVSYCDGPDIMRVDAEVAGRLFLSLFIIFNRFDRDTHVKTFIAIIDDVYLRLIHKATLSINVFRLVECMVKKNTIKQFWRSHQKVAVALRDINIVVHETDVGPDISAEAHQNYVHQQQQHNPTYGFNRQHSGSAVSTHNALQQYQQGPHQPPMHNSREQYMMSHMGQHLSRQQASPSVSVLQPQGSSRVPPLSGQRTGGLFDIKPDDTSLSKINFIFNNLSKSNLETKTKELNDLIKDENMFWVIRNLIHKRVGASQGFHELYSHVMESFQEKFSKCIPFAVDVIVSHLKNFLKAFDDHNPEIHNKTTIKNLAKFLGMISLAKNRPLHHDDIDFKTLLVESYFCGHIHCSYAVAITSQCLVSTKDSFVFQIPNPWTVSLLNVLHEIYEHFQNNSEDNSIVFEIEILFGELNFVHRASDRTPLLNDPHVYCYLEQYFFRKRPCATHSHNRQVMLNMETMDTNSAGANVQDSESYPVYHFPSHPASYGSTQMDIPRAKIPYYPTSTGAMSTQQFTPPMQTHIQTTNLHIPLNNILHQTQKPVPLNPLPSSVPAPSQPAYNPKLHYKDVRCDNLDSMERYIQIDDSYFSRLPEIRKEIIGGFVKALRELYIPVYDRAQRNIIGTVEGLVCKDFVADNNAAKMRACAQAMARYLACSTVLIVAREALMVTLVAQYRFVVLKSSNMLKHVDKSNVDSNASQCASQNIDVILAYLQKLVAERVVSEIDVRIDHEYARRITSAVENRPITTGINLPDCVKISCTLSLDELRVYEEFQRTIPGFVSGSFGKTLQESVDDMIIINKKQYSHLLNPGSIEAPEVMCLPSGQVVPSNVPKPSGEGVEPYELIIKQVEKHFQPLCALINSTSPICTTLRNIIDKLYLAGRSNNAEVVVDIINYTVKCFMELYDVKQHIDKNGIQILERSKEAYLAVLRNIRVDRTKVRDFFLGTQVVKSWQLMNEPDEDSVHVGKWNIEAFKEILKTHCLCLYHMDKYLSSLIESNHLQAIVFSLRLIELLIIGERREYTMLNEYDIHQTIGELHRLAASGCPIDMDRDVKMRLRNASETLKQYLDLGLLVNYQSTHTTDLYTAISMSREFDDRVINIQSCQKHMQHWFQLYAKCQHNDEKEFNEFLLHLAQDKLLEDDLAITRFFRLATVLVIEGSSRRMKNESSSMANSQGRYFSYTEIDAYAVLLAKLIQKACDNGASLQLLNKALGIIAGMMIQELEIRPMWFHPMPFQRALQILFMELHSVTALTQGVLPAFCNTYHVLRPMRIGGFAFCWLELVSNRVFMAKMLSNLEVSNYNAPMYAQLLVDTFKYVRTFMNNNRNTSAFKAFYHGFLKYLLILMHDFPEILCDYHSLYCDYIGPTSSQLRNIVLCATPKSIIQEGTIEPIQTHHIPQMISQIVDPVGYCMSAGSRIVPVEIKRSLDAYIQTRSPVTFLLELTNALKTENDAFYPYDLMMMNNLMLYLCITAVNTLREKNLPLDFNTISHTGQMDIIQNLVLNLDNAGRYLLLNVMANQLRYPNSHTYFFNRVLLYLFSEQEKVAIKEQITRVLVERVIVHRPHPWGLLATIAELLQNPNYRFWEHEFANCCVQIHKMLKSVVGSISKTSTSDGRSAIAAH